jgi:homoserine O-acetyltransferase
MVACGIASARESALGSRCLENARAGAKEDPMRKLFFATAALVAGVVAGSAAAQTPETFDVTVKTTRGDFVIEVHRAWSPHGADRFFELAKARYYDDSRFFRVVAGKWVQFGIAGDPATAKAWRNRTIPDDALVEHNLPGYIAFSNTGPGTRSTQVYINLRDNSAQNDREPAFAPFGKVVKGMDVVESLYSGYGESSGSGMRAGHQDAMFDGGDAYLDANFPKLDRLISLQVTRAGR